MLIQLAGCHRHPPSHFASWFTYPLTLSLHLSMQAVGLELRKSSFDSLWAVLIYVRFIGQYFSLLSSLPPSIHPCGQLTHKLITHTVWYIKKRRSLWGKSASFGVKQCYFMVCYALDIGAQTSQLQCQWVLAELRYLCARYLILLNPGELN